MKPTSILLLALAIIALILPQQKAGAQMPEKMSYQAVIRNSSDQLVANTNIGMQISILQGSLTGKAVYVEQQTTSANANGLVSIEIGGGTVISGSFTAIDWASGTYYIKTETDPAGGTNYTITGTSQILSVPYALYAKKAETTEIFNITGDENVFSGWDKNEEDDFNGQYASLTGKPAFAEVATSGSYADLLNKPSLFDGTWSSLTGKPTFAAIATSGLYSDLQSKPTTLSGYGITDAMSTFHAANGISASQIANWNTAYGWGNHAGLYRLISYVPAWSEITSNIFSISAPSNNQLLKYNSTSGKWENWTPYYLTNFTETDPVWTSVSANYYTKTNLQTSGQSLVNANNISSGTLGVARGGTGATILTGILIGNGTGTFTAITHSAGNQYLRRNAGNTAYEFTALSGVAVSGNYNDLLNKPTMLNNTLYTTATGYQALNSNTGSGNSAFGYHALVNNLTGYENTANGGWALSNNSTGKKNTATGFGALCFNSSGYWNTADGDNALYTNTIGYENTATGASSLYSNHAGSCNTAYGCRALFSNYDAVSNTAIGLDALYYNTNGDGNTALGRSAGSSTTTGWNNTSIGYNSQPSSSTANNQITLGDWNITSLRCNVQSISSLSDARDKKNISDLSLGLDFIMKIKPRQFNWDRREWYTNNQSDGSKMQQTPTAGFIAQELDEAQQGTNAEWLNLVLKDNPEKLEATYGNLLPIMVKAIQEQQMQIEELNKEIALLKSR